jgi:hypothetical protein
LVIDVGFDDVAGRDIAGLGMARRNHEKLTGCEKAERQCAWVHFIYSELKRYDHRGQSFALACFGFFNLPLLLFVGEPGTKRGLHVYRPGREWNVGGVNRGERNDAGGGIAANVGAYHYIIAGYWRCHWEPGVPAASVK